MLVSTLSMPILVLVIQFLSLSWSGSRWNANAFAFGGSTSNKANTNQLEIAFVTGNEMKVRELTKILAKEGAIDVDNPDQSWGTSVVNG
jgi:hypothetical protein